MTTLADLLKITRPISYKNEDKCWPYSTRGSCVVVGCFGRLYIVTAKHVTKDYKPSQILVPYEEGDNHFLPLKEAFVPRTTENEDTDHKDIILIEIWRKELDVNRLKKTSIADISTDAHKQLTSETRYIVSGYPFSLNRVDYEKQCISHQAACIPALPMNPNVYIGVDQIKFDSDGGLKSDSDICTDDPFNGLSGGGIFSLTPNGHGNNTVAFQGILLRATASSRIGYILKTDLIKHYILGHQKETQAKEDQSKGT
jgi:hypothetical protein